MASKQEKDVSTWIPFSLFICTSLIKLYNTKNSSVKFKQENETETSGFTSTEETLYTLARSRHRLSFDHTHDLQTRQEDNQHFEHCSTRSYRSLITSPRYNPDLQDMGAYDSFQDLIESRSCDDDDNCQLEVETRKSTAVEKYLHMLNGSFSSIHEDIDENEEVIQEELSLETTNTSQTSRFSRWRSAYNKIIMPNKVIMIRHGQSEGNVSEFIYAKKPDNEICLTKLGWEQARMAGKALREILDEKNDGSTIHFIVSPYVRTMETFHGLLSAWSDPDVDFAHIQDPEKKKRMWYKKLKSFGITWAEDPRIREQDFGNYQDRDTINIAKKERHKFGAFYYRFPNGESASDVYDRASTFLDSLWRSFDANRSQHYVLVTHGISVRVLLMRYFRYSVDEFHMLSNPKNCEMVVLGHDGKGKLDLHGRCELELAEKDTTEGNEDASDRISVTGFKFFKRLRVLPKKYQNLRSIRISSQGQG